MSYLRAIRTAALVAVLLASSTPASAAVTFGSTAVGSPDDSDSNNLNGSKITTGALTAHVTSASVYVGAVDSAPNNRFQISIYTDNNGTPATLLVTSANTALAANAWNTVAMSATLQPNTSYWLIYNSNGRTSALNNMTYLLGGAGRGVYSANAVPFGTWPSTFPTFALTAGVYGLYVTADTSGVDPRGTVGEWAPVQNWPLIAIHSNLLKNGKVLVWDEQFAITEPLLWDPATEALSSTPLVGSELFCAGHTQLANGRILAAGGHEPNQGEAGTNFTYQYDPDTNTWLPTGDMLYDRWYPAVTKLSDGRVAIFSGQITDNVFADPLEMYNPANGSVSVYGSITTPQLKEEEYPANFLLPSGKVLAISPEHGPVQLFDAGPPSWTNLNTTPIRFGAAVQYRPGRILMTGGGPAFFATASGQAAILDTTAPAPSWRSINAMSQGRYMHNLVMLPTGDVLAVGGSTTVYQQASTGVLPAELWDADAETWSTMASLSIPRMYHSTALLLPDGRVLSAGGGHNGNAPNFPSAQVYSPSYLFRGARPVISGAPGALSYGAAPFTITTAAAASIAKVNLVSLGSVTHCTDMNQSFTPLSFTAGAGQLTVAQPPDANQVPPGFYMLFIVDNDDVPSVAAIVQVSGTSPSPSATPTSTPIVPTATATRTATAAPASPTATSTPVAPSATATRTFTSAPPPSTATQTATAGVSSPTATPNTITLGWTAIGSIMDDGDSNHLNGSRIAVGPAGAQVTSISVYVGNVDTPPNDRYQVGIYTNSGGVPGALVVNSPVASLVANAWNTVAVSASLTANTTYWLIYNSNGRTGALNNMAYDLGSAGQGTYSAAPVSFGTWPANFGPAALTAGVYSLYASASSGNPPASPTATVALPTATATAPPATASQTATGVPATPADTGTATAVVPTATATRTSTAAPATPTNTNTATAVAPTATATRTSTSIPPTSTRTSTATAPLPTATATRTSSGAPVTLGLTAIGSVQDDGDSNHLNGSRVLSTAAGQIASLSVYVGSIDSAAANRTFQMAIYTDAAGRPGSLVATTVAGTLVSNAWNTLSITATLQATTNYWLIYNSNGRTGAVNNMRYNTGAVGQGVYSSSGVTFGTWPTTFPPSTLTNGVYSLYATYAP